MNEEIRASEVRVIDEKGEQIGIMPLEEALQLAREKELDLVEVGTNAKPPACRLLDFDKLRYIRKKKREKSRKNVKKQELKEIRLSPNTSENDIQIKTKKSRKFLEDGDKVKILIQFKGREITHPELGQDIIKRILEQLSDASEVESPPKMEGKRLIVILKPIES